MPERIFIILVVLIFNFYGEGFAQSYFVEKKLGISTFYSPNSGNMNKNRELKNFLKTASLGTIYHGIDLKNAPSASINSHSRFAGGYYNNPVSFFCRQELNLEKATSIQLRFRLGSIDYTDYLERKPNAKRPER